MQRQITRFVFSGLLLMAVATTDGSAQSAPPRATLPPLPAPLAVPKPGPVTDGPYAPQPIVAGGIVVPLYPAGSPFLKAERVREAEQYNMSQVVPGRMLDARARLIAINIERTIRGEPPLNTIDP